MSDDPSAPLSRPPRLRFGGAATTLLRAVFAGLALGAAAAGYAVYQYFHSPYWTRVGFAPDQPVLFSHRHHAGELRLDCRFCHATVETAAFAGMPATRTCLGCHDRILSDAALLAPVRRSAETRTPIAWNRVTRLPDHVYFHHGIHVSRGVACAACHGKIEDMALTAKAHALDMRECLACHRQEEARATAVSARSSSVPPAGGFLESRAGQSPRVSRLTSCSTCHH